MPAWPSLYLYEINMVRLTNILLAGGMILIVNPVAAQETLPNFSLEKLNTDKVRIHWKNPDTTLRQLSIQQSADSLTGFKTIITVLSPQLEQNGSVIGRPKASKMFYRIYLLYPRGKYIFTASKLPGEKSPAVQNTPSPPLSTKTKAELSKSKAEPDTVKNVSVKTTPPANRVKKDSSDNKVPVLKEKFPAEKKENKKQEPVPEPVPEPVKRAPSPYLSTLPDGYPFIKLPAEWVLTQVQIRFFEENGEKLFVLTDPPIRTFRIDKTNFTRAGWYNFEIWHKGVKIETNRFYLPLEF